MNNAERILRDLQENAVNQPVVQRKADLDISSQTMTELNIPENSLLGALVQSGGFSIADGRLRLLGGSAKDEISLLSVSNRSGYDWQSELVIVAFDIYGNVYAINVGYSPEFKPGEIIAFFSDGTDWESTADGIGEFLSYCFEGDLNATFIDFETNDEALETEARASDGRVINFYPPLFAKEGSPQSSSKSLVDLVEAIRLRKALTGVLSH